VNKRETGLGPLHHPARRLRIGGGFVARRASGGAVFYAIVLRDYYNITIAQLVQHLAQLGPLTLRPADPICEKLPSSHRP